MPPITRSIAIFALVAVTLVSAADAQQVSRTGEAPRSFHAMASDKLPAVVSIQTTQRVTGPAAPRQVPEGLQEFMERFFGENFMQEFQQQRARPVQAPGSGFIVTRDGYVVTNNHVVENATSVHLRLYDGTGLPAEIVGRDPKTDLALLKVDSDRPLPTLEWGNSDQALIGDWVIAIGNPFGLGGSVTAGSRSFFYDSKGSSRPMWLCLSNPGRAETGRSAARVTATGPPRVGTGFPA